MSSASEGNENEVYEIHLKNLVGGASTHKVGTVQELRVRLALEAGVLSPCIVLCKCEGHRVVEDTDEIGEVFRGEAQPYELYSINNEEGAKKDVTGWSADKWLDAVEAHGRYGDERLMDTQELLRPLKLADKEFERKMREWGEIIFEKAQSHRLLDEVAGRVKAALALGVSVGAFTGPDRTTLLHRAAEFGHTDLLRTLLHASEEVDVDGAGVAGITPLGKAAREGHLDAVALLLGARVDVSVSVKDPLWYATGRGRPDVVALLIKAGAKVNEANDRGTTVLHYASECGHVEVIHVLLLHGAHGEAEDNNGDTPYDCALDEETRKALKRDVRENHLHCDARS